MITGYNTDIRHNGVVYHVQTEDKGRNNPLIESLVYVGGLVLASKRREYGDLLEGDVDEQLIIQRMEKQHRTLIAAIRQGKFEEKAIAAGIRPKPSSSEAAPLAVTPVPPATTGEFEPPLSSELSQPVTQNPPKAPAPRPPASPALFDDSLISLDQGTLDQVILEYLTSEADQEQLLLLIDEAGFALGQRTDLAVRARASKSGRPISGAEVQVRMISTVEEPHVLAEGLTGEDGALGLSFDIPSLERGTAALIISAASELGRAEFKQLL